MQCSKTQQNAKPMNHALYTAIYNKTSHARFLCEHNSWLQYLKSYNEQATEYLRAAKMPLNMPTTSLTRSLATLTTAVFLSSFPLCRFPSSLCRTCVLSSLLVGAMCCMYVSSYYTIESALFTYQTSSCEIVSNHPSTSASQ